MKYKVILKDGVFPAIKGNERVILKNITQKNINEMLDEALKELSLTRKDVEIVKDVEILKQELNQQRDKELEGFVIDDFYMNKSIIYDMSVYHATLQDDEKARWIDINNQTVELTKEELGNLIVKGRQKVEEIYFRYRKLKDELEA